MENDNGQCVCTLLTYREKEDTFEIYKYQIFYNSRYNDWDCSTNFGDHNDDDDDEDTDPGTFTLVDLEAGGAVIHAPSPSIMMDAGPMPDNQVEGESSKMLAFPLDLLQYCFGFFPKFIQALYPAGVCRVTDKDWNTFLISLGYQKDSCEQLPFAGAMFDFLDSIHVEKGKETKGPPTMIHDLTGGSPAPLALTQGYVCLWQHITGRCPALGWRVQSYMILCGTESLLLALMA